MHSNVEIATLSWRIVFTVEKFAPFKLKCFLENSISRYDMANISTVKQWVKV